ncbi:pyruvate carboxylase [compost metagenome]
MYHGFELEGATFDVQLSKSATGYRLHLGQRTLDVNLRPGRSGAACVIVGSIDKDAFIAKRGDDVYVHLDGETYHLRYRHPLDRLAALSDASAEDHVRAPMPGAVVSVLVMAQESVTRGQALLVMESMKMETTITAPRDGVVKVVHHDTAQTFDRDSVLISLEPQT